MRILLYTLFSVKLRHGNEKNPAFSQKKEWMVQVIVSTFRGTDHGGEGGIRTLEAFKGLPR